MAGECQQVEGKLSTAVGIEVNDKVETIKVAWVPKGLTLRLTILILIETETRQVDVQVVAGDLLHEVTQCQLHTITPTDIPLAVT